MILTDQVVNLIITIITTKLIDIKKMMHSVNIVLNDQPINFDQEPILSLFDFFSSKKIF